MIITALLHMQVEIIPGLQSRFMHSATAFSLSPELKEVTLFGGIPEWPRNLKSDADFTHVSNTTVLRFGESLHVCTLGELNAV